MPPSKTIDLGIVDCCQQSRFNGLNDLRFNELTILKWNVQRRFSVLFVDRNLISSSIRVSTTSDSPPIARSVAAPSKCSPNATRAKSSASKSKAVDACGIQAKAH